MQIENNDRRFLALILLLISFIVLVLFFRPIYSNFLVSYDEKNLKEQTLLEKQTELQKLNDLKIQLDKQKDDKSSMIYKLSVPLNENEILEYLYSFTSAYQGWVIISEWLSVSEGTKNEIGFMEANVNLSASVSSKQALIDLINFLISKDSKYQFFITSFSYNESEDWQSIKVDIPMKMFYINQK